MIGLDLATSYVAKYCKHHFNIAIDQDGVN